MSTSEGQLRFGEKVIEARLKWFGYIQRRASGYTGQRMPGRRKRGRPQKRFMDVVEENIQRKNCCGDP